MSTLVADFINFFDAQVVQNSSGHSILAILLSFLSVFLNLAFFISMCKNKDSPKSPPDHKEDKK